MLQIAIFWQNKHMQTNNQSTGKDIHAWGPDGSKSEETYGTTASGYATEDAFVAIANRGGGVPLDRLPSEDAVNKRAKRGYGRSS